MQNKLTKIFYNKNSYSRNLDFFFTDKQLESYRTYFLNERKIFFKHLKINKKCTMLDVGTGKNSVALEKFFNKIDHFDISHSHVKFLKKKIAKKLNIVSKIADLENIQLKDNHYDFINLDGIVMHTKSPKKLLINIFKSLKLNGVVKILIYKKGSLKFLLVEFLREIIKKGERKKKGGRGDIKILNPYKNTIKDWLFDDDLYVPFIRLFEDKEIINFLTLLNGNKKYFIKHKNVNLLKSIDTKKFHHSETFFITKKNFKEFKNLKLNFSKQLNANFLKNDNFFYQNCGKLMLQILKNKNKMNNLSIIKKSIVKIYKVALFKIFYPQHTYLDLIKILNKELNILIKSYN
jgi:ubiquinone/menaquinone biosynthesis C-methylase UbiE